MRKARKDARERAGTAVSKRAPPLAALVASAVLVLSACQTTRPGEAVGYRSSNIDFFRDAFAGRLDDDPVGLEGRLFLPEGGRPTPVVIWQHGSGHPYNPNYADWREDLRGALAAEGIGFFIADSFSGRNLRGTAEDQTRLSGASRVTDALRALEALAADPRVDGDRIGIAGTSWGGAVAIRASHEPYAEAVLPGGPRFAAHVPFYPHCNAQFERHEPTGAPLLFLVGGADNYTAPEYCEQLADKMRQAGAEVEAVVYPGAHHGFISSKYVYRYDRAWQVNDCGVAVLGRDGEMRTDKRSSEGSTYGQFVRQVILNDNCADRGVTIGRNEEAAQDALKRTVTFFVEHLKT